MASLLKILVIGAAGHIGSRTGPKTGATIKRMGNTGYHSEGLVTNWNTVSKEMKFATK